MGAVQETGKFLRTQANRLRRLPHAGDSYGNIVLPDGRKANIEITHVDNRTLSALGQAVELTTRGAFSPKDLFGSQPKRNNGIDVIITPRITTGGQFVVDPPPGQSFTVENVYPLRRRDPEQVTKIKRAGAYEEVRDKIALAIATLSTARPRKLAGA